MFSTSDLPLPIDIPNSLARTRKVTFYNLKLGQFSSTPLLWKPIDGPEVVYYNESRLYLELNHVDISKT